jgi:hypothetical protein
MHDNLKPPLVHISEFMQPGCPLHAATLALVQNDQARHVEYGPVHAMNAYSE